MSAGRSIRAQALHPTLTHATHLRCPVVVSLRTGPCRCEAEVAAQFVDDAEALLASLAFVWSAGRFETLEEAADFGLRLVLWPAPLASLAEVALTACAEPVTVHPGEAPDAVRRARRIELTYAAEVKPWGTVDVVAEVPAQGLYRLNVAPGQGIPEHVHRVMGESERVLDAGLWGWVGDAAPRPLPVGTRFDWPADLPHGYYNAGDRPATVLCLDRPRFMPEDEVETGVGVRRPPPVGERGAT